MGYESKLPIHMSILGSDCVTHHDAENAMTDHSVFAVARQFDLQVKGNISERARFDYFQCHTCECVQIVEFETSGLLSTELLFIQTARVSISSEPKAARVLPSERPGCHGCCRLAGRTGQLFISRSL